MKSSLLLLRRQSAILLVIVLNFAFINDLHAQPEGLIFWNTMDSKFDVENSNVGPDIIQTTYIFPLWGEAQIASAKFGNGLFINHDTNEGWQNDGGNFFALDNEAMGMLPNKGTIEFWMRFMYDCTFHNWAPMFVMQNELTGHFTYWPPDRPGTYFHLVWSGWDWGTYGKRYQFGVGNGVDEFSKTGTDYSTYPGGDLEFYTNDLSHFAVVWDVDGIDGTNETMRLYVDGQVAISHQEPWISPEGIVNYTYLGTSPNGTDTWDHAYNAFKGVMDNLKIWNYSKTNFDDRFFEGFITCPDNLTVDSDEDLSPDNLGYPEVIVNCEGEVIFDYNDVTIPGSSPNDNTVERSWTITDACGNHGSCTQIINVINSQVCTGDITLSSQAEVDAFNCTKVTDNLTISGSDITNLDALSGLTKVGDWGDEGFYIRDNPSLTSIDGLSGLIEVQAIEILQNNALTNVNGLSGLKNADYIAIGWNSALSNVDGLSGLTKVSAIQIRDNPALTNIDGLSLSGLTAVSGYLNISNNDALTNIDGLSGLREVGISEFADNKALTNVDGLSGLTMAHSISIRNNNALANLDGLSGLKKINYSIGVYENDALTNLDGLSGLTEAIFVQIRDNPALTNIDGLSGLIEVGKSLRIQDNPALTRCCGLYPLLSSGGVAGTIYISYNGAGCTEADIITFGPCVNCENDITLSTQVEVDAFHCTEVTGKLTISGSDITNLDALLGLTVVGDLSIQSNNALTNIDGLSGLTEVGSDLRIQDNPALALCCGLYPLLSRGGVAGTIYISNNGAGCTEADIIANGPCVNCETDIKLSTQAEVDAFPCTKVTGKLTISGSDITNLDALSGLTVVGDLSIQSNNALTNIDGLSGLTEVGDIYFDFNSALTNIDGLSGLTVVGDIGIHGNNALTNVNGLSGLTEVGDIYFDYNSALTNVNGLLGLTKAGNIAINGNGALTNIDGLSGLTEVGGIYFEFTALTNVDGLSGVTKASSIRIGYNNALTNIDGLSGLTEVGDDLSIGENYSLNRCCGLYTLLSSGTVGGSISINYNGDAFSCTESEIIANGPCSGEGTLIVNAKGSDAGGVYAHFTVNINGQEIGDAYTTSNYEAYAFTFSWTLPNNPGMIQDISIVFNNDAVIDGSDRNLYVQSIALNGEVVPATGDNVTYDAGAYNGVMPWNGILYFGINVPDRKLIVNAKGSDAGGVYAHFRVIVNGQEIGEAYTTSDYEAYAFTLPNDLGMIQDVGIVFDNDAEIDGSDRNLYIQSIALNGVLIPAPGDYVTYDGGTYNGIMQWNGILYFGINDLYAETCNGDIILSSQAEVDAFNCEVVKGRLTIGGGWYLHPSDITNLDGLSELQSVGGLSVNYNPFISDLDALGGLSGNIGDISIWENEALENLDGLKGINSVEGSIEIAYYNDALENLDGLSNVTSVGGNLSIWDNSNLNRCCGLYPLLSSGGVAGTIDISGNSAGCTEADIIANGPCDPGDYCIGDITLSSQVEVDAFNCTEVTGKLTISGDDITNLDALSGLTEVGDDLSVSGNNALSNIEGFSELEKVGGDFYISENPLLENLIGLSSLKSVNGSFRILSNDALTNVDGLSGLTKVGNWMEISHNDVLINIDGLLMLTEAGRMIIRDNEALPNVDGLSVLTKVDVIRIMENDALTNIDGLSALTQVGDELLIAYNENLFRCCGLYPLLSSGAVGGSISIGSNGSGCTESDIVEGGSCSPCCYIHDLKNDGVLNKGHANALMKKLLWISKIENYSYRHHFSANKNWSRWNDRVVKFLLRSFYKHVEVLVKCGKLSPAQGQTLAVLASLSHECNFDCGDQNSNLRIEELIADDISLEGMMDFELIQNYPNPASDLTYIPFIIPESTHVLLKLTDELGREVETVFNKHVSEGFHEVELNTNSLVDGIYFYTMQTEKFHKTLPMVIKKY